MTFGFSVRVRSDGAFELNELAPPETIHQLMTMPGNYRRLATTRQGTSVFSSR